MQEENELIVRIYTREKYFIRVTPKEIYQFKEQSKVQKKIFVGTKKLTVRILKTEIVEKTYRFIVRIAEDKTYVDALIDGKLALQALLKMTGQYSLVVGLQELLTSFRKVGEGAFAQVFEVITNYQQRFALKSFEKKTFAENDKSRQAFENQVLVLSKLKSPYIVPYQYLFQTDKAFYLKMEFFQKSLKEKIAGKLLVKQQKEFMRQLVTALSEMKKKNVIHRDLKPDNIMVRQTQRGEECVIIDFGLATFADAKQYIFGRCGTPGFLAPEIANLTNKKDKQACSADMFSLGCIFYKMLTGHYIFGGKTGKEVLQNNRKCNYVNSSFSGLSVNQRHLLVKMLQSSPLKRITPEDALKQPYFKDDVDDSDQIPDQQCFLNKYLRKMGGPQETKNMDSIRSSCLSISHLEQSTASQAIKNFRKESMKDSCLTFQLKGHLNLDSQEQSVLTKTNRSNRSQGARSRDKSLRQSRFSRLGKDITNMV